MTITFDVGRIAKHLLLGLLVMMSLAGGAVAYHFYWPTQVKADGHRVNRAQLIDWVIDRELQRK